MHATISPVGRFLRPAARFIRHLLEMCAAMCLGLAVLDVLYVGVARLFGYSDPIHQLPELSVVVAAVNMSVPMMAWMRFRGHEWRPIWEMTGAMFVEAIVLIGLAGAGVAARGNLFVLMHGFMMPAMIVPMLFRLDMYTSAMHHHARRAKAVPSVEAVPSGEKVPVRG